MHCRRRFLQLSISNRPSNTELNFNLPSESLDRT